MNNRFKFRFWRKNYEGKWIPEYPDLMSVDGLALPYDNGEGGAYNTYDDVVVEQCTGLKDKNGKLVYEGDIIRVEDNNSPVSWDNENARYEVSGYGEIAYLNYYDIEVIGNIHENTEILEQGNDNR